MPTPIRCVLAVVLMEGESEGQAVARMNRYLNRGWLCDKRDKNGEIGHVPPEVAVDADVEVALTEFVQALENSQVLIAYYRACDILGRKPNVSPAEGFDIGDDFMGDVDDGH